MKILTKRCFAALIDSFIFAMLLVLATEVIPPEYFEVLGVFGYLILFVPFFMRDLLFRNASLGKKLLGISIYSENWTVPSIKTLLLRAPITMTVGYSKVIKAMLIDGNYLGVIDWERECLKTQVVDNKIFKHLDNEAKKSDKNYCANMSAMYSEYLNNIYIK